MGNLIRLKQIDKPEVSGYIEQVGDSRYYSQSNPSGYISSVAANASFQELSGDLSAVSGDLYAKLAATGQTVSTNLASTGQTLDAKIDSLSGYVEVSNNNISIISGNVNTAELNSTGYAFNLVSNLSGDVTSLSGYVVNSDTSLSSQISNVNTNLSSRINSLEGVFAASGSNFVDLNSNNQTVVGQKNFEARTNFKLLNVVPVTGDYINPGGLNTYSYTQFTDDTTFFVSGISGFESGGYMTGDLFVNKIVYPNNEEVIVSSFYYTGNY